MAAHEQRQDEVTTQANLLRDLADPTRVIDAARALRAIESKAYQIAALGEPARLTRAEEEAQKLAVYQPALTALASELDTLIPAWIARFIEHHRILQEGHDRLKKALAAGEKRPRQDLSSLPAVDQLKRTLRAVGERVDPHVGPLIGALEAIGRDADEDLASVLERTGPAAAAALPKLLSILRTQGVWHWPSQLARAITNVSRFDGAALDALREMLSSDDEKMRISTMEVLAVLGPRGRPAADELLAFENGNVSERCLAIHALGKQGTPTAEFLDLLERAMRDADGYVSRAAAHVLGELTPEPGRFVPLLVAACDRALELHKEDLPDAAVTALGEYGPPARDALPRLRQFLEGPIKGRTVRSDLVETAIRSITADTVAVKPAGVAGRRTEPLLADEPLFAVAYEQKQCYIDRQGRFVLRTRFVGGEPFRDGRAIVCDQASRTFVIDRQGREVFESQWDEIRSFAEGRAAVKKDDRWGFVDRDGRTVVEPQYDGVWDFAEGLAGFSIGGKEVPFGKSGSWRAPGLKGFIDRTGTVVIPPVWPRISSFREGLAAVCVGGRKQSSPLLGGHEILLDQKYGYIDRTGKLVIPGGYDLANRFFEGRAVVSNQPHECRARQGYIDADGNAITPLKFTSASAFRDGLAVVKRRGRKWRKVTFVIDRAGAVVAELPFSEVKPFSEGLAAASSGDGFGFIDLDGKWVIEPQFDQVDPFQNSLAEVQRGNWYGLIDKTGQFIWGPTTEGTLFWKCESD